jgi:hypothetical protein
LNDHGGVFANVGALSMHTRQMAKNSKKQMPTFVRMIAICNDVLVEQILTVRLMLTI